MLRQSSNKVSHFVVAHCKWKLERIVDFLLSNAQCWVHMKNLEWAQIKSKISKLTLILPELNHKAQTSFINKILNEE